MAIVRFEGRTFRRLEKFTNKKDEWEEWRTHLLTAIRECVNGRLRNGRRTDRRCHADTNLAAIVSDITGKTDQPYG